MTMSARDTERRHVLAIYRADDALQITQVICDVDGLDYADAEIAGHRGKHYVSFSRTFGWRCRDRRDDPCPDASPCRHLQAVQRVVAKPPRTWSPPAPNWQPGIDDLLDG